LEKHSHCQGQESKSRLRQGCSIAKQHTKPYKGGRQAVNVQWLFEGVTELLPIYEKLGDGTEIMWAEHRQLILKNIRSRVRKKGEFHQ
jgi:hypothetical protein